ncbi:MAG: hypothetical protein WCI18_17425 [Pseudomonadota bacterium]
MFRCQVPAIIILAIFVTTACQRSYNSNEANLDTLTTSTSPHLEADVQGFVKTWFAGFDSH